MPIRNTTADTLARLHELEQRLDHVEKNGDWDALAPQIAAVEQELRRTIESDASAVDAGRSAFVRGHGVFARLFNSGVRQEFRESVGALEADLQQAQSGEHKLHQLKARFFDDKMRVHAREFIRVASKVQKNVSGGWEEKALVAAGRWLTGSTGDEAIDFVKQFRTSHPNASAEQVLVAQLALPHSAVSASDVEHALDATGAMPKDHEARDLLRAAAVLSGAPASASANIVAKMSGKIDGMWDGAAPVVAAAILVGAEPARAIAFANAASKLLAGAEGSASIIAAGLLAGRSVDDTVKTAREIEKGVAGTLQARAAIAAAGVLSGRPAGEVIAFAKHVQSQLAGTWESEATIICAGILGAPGTIAPDEVRRAFALRSLVRPGDDD